MCRNIQKTTQVVNKTRLYTDVLAARSNVKLLQWKRVFKSPFWIQKLQKAEILTEYLYDLVF